MEQVVSTILTSAEPGQTRAGVIYRVTDQAGTVYASWTPAVYETARMYIGRPVLLTYDESQSADGRFTNRNLRLIEPADGQQAPLSPAQLPGPPGGIQEMIQQQLAPPAPPAPTVQPTKPRRSSRRPRRRRSTIRTRSIRRSSRRSGARSRSKQRSTASPP